MTPLPILHRLGEDAALECLDEISTALPTMDSRTNLEALAAAHPGDASGAARAAPCVFAARAARTRVAHARVGFDLLLIAWITAIIAAPPCDDAEQDPPTGTHQETPFPVGTCL